VRTALDALGTPYQWGGTAANGFDCSGLIQYAYGQHGVRLPRTSRDQAGSGTTITPVVEALQPGDILLFSATPGAGVTHVGMYVGEGKFIHSSSTGVRLSQLDPHDPRAVTGCRAGSARAGSCNSRAAWRPVPAARGAGLRPRHGATPTTCCMTLTSGRGA